MFNSLDISASALSAERFRMNIISNNIANANTTRTPEGGPYRRQLPVFEERELDFSDMLEAQFMGVEPTGKGVRVTGVVEDETPFKRVYNLLNLIAALKCSGDIISFITLEAEFNM